MGMCVRERVGVFVRVIMAVPVVMLMLMFMRMVMIPFIRHYRNQIDLAVVDTGR